MARRGPGSSFEEHAEELRKRLTQFMQSKGLTVTGWAKRAGVTEGTLRSFLGRRSKTLTHATLLALADAAQEPVTALLAGTSIWGDTTRVEVTVKVSGAEHLNETLCDLGRERYNIQVPMPFPKEVFMGALIVDDSANAIWNSGSIIVCADF